MLIRKHILAFSFLALFNLVALLGCTLGKTTFGGSETPEDFRKMAGRLLESEDMILELHGSDILLNGGDVETILNTKATTNFPSGTLDLTPDAAGIGSFASGWLTISPSATNEKFRSPGGATLEYEELTVIALVKNSSRGTVFSFDPSDTSTEAFSLKVTPTKISAGFESGAGSRFVSELNLPTSETSIIAASYGATAEELIFSVNGILAGSAVVTGAGSGPLLLNRSIAVGPEQTSENLEIKALYVFTKRLEKIELGSMILYMAEKEGVTGVTLDPSMEVSDPTVDPRFPAVKTILASNCTTCHSAWNGASASYFVGQGLVNKSSPETSPLFYRLRGSSGSQGPKTMPVSGPLSDADRDAIKNWIQLM